MPDKSYLSTPSIFPLGRVFHLKELPGWLGKRIQVPPGRLGVAIDKEGTVRTFPTGSHQILSAWQRLLGKGVGLQVGLVPSEEFTAQLKLDYLLSGDGILLDLLLVCGLQVSDAGIFFSKLVLPQGEIHANGFYLDPGLLQAPLGALVTRYAAADLLHGRLDAALAAQVQSSLVGSIGSLGLQATTISLFSLSRSEKRLELAEKAQSLKERLQDVDLQAKMTVIENQAQLDEFIQQLDPEIQQLAQVQMGENASPSATVSLKGKVGAFFYNWLGAESNQEHGKRRWMIEGLFKHKQAAVKTPGIEKGPRPRQGWWVGRVVWMLAVLLLALILSGLVNLIASATSWNNPLEILLIIWGFTLGVILESIKALYEKREAISESSWNLPGFQHLDDLVGNNRVWADQVVREHCTRELVHIRETVAEVRGSEYKRGKTDLALQLRNEVEHNIEECSQKIGRPDFGRPPYVTDLHISRHGWEHMLDNDEDLLLLANALSDRAHLLQQRSQAGEPIETLAADLNAQVTSFCNRFFERGRPLQVQPAE